MIEGLVFKELMPELKITLNDFDEVHNQLRKHYQNFWELTNSPKVIQSTVSDWHTGDNGDEPIHLTVHKPVGSKPHNNELVVGNDWKCINEVPDCGDLVVAVAFHYNNNLLAYRYQNQLVKIWHLNQNLFFELGKKLFPDCYGTLSSISFSPDEILIATGYIHRLDQNVVKVWNLKKEESYSLHGHQFSEFGRVYSVCFSPADKQVIASAGTDKVVRIWDIPSQSKLNELVKHSADIKSIAISPNGQTLISGDEKGIVNIWRVKSGKHLKTIEAHRLPINSVTYSPSNDLFATCSDDAKVKLWDVSTAQLLCTLSGHDEPVNSVSFGVDGKILASGSDDCTVRIWNLDNPNNPIVLHEHQDAVSSVAFSPNGQLLASGSFDGTVKIWKQKTDLKN